MIPTPDGWSRLSEIVIGSKVFDESGRVCAVTETFDSLPDVSYRLWFSDGTFVDACGDHQWVTWTHAERKALNRSPHEDHGRFPGEWPAWRLKRIRGTQVDRKRIESAFAIVESGKSWRQASIATGVNPKSLRRAMRAGGYVPRAAKVYDDSPGPRIRTTQEIVDTLTIGKRGDTNHCIPTAGALDLPDVEVPIDPYVLGAWLGDGSTASGDFTAHQDDQPFLRAELRRAGYEPTLRKDPQSVGAIGLLVDLRRAGVLGNKHCPSVYLRGSIAQRTAMLCGLMDTDGYCDPISGCVEFCNTNKRLVDAVVELSRSLGQKPAIYAGEAKLNGRVTGPKWRVCWRPTVAAFRLPRKLAMVRMNGDSQGLRNCHRMIVRAERIDPKPMRCLTVDSRHRMYLAGEGMIPTHNTRSNAELVVAEVMAGRARRVGFSSFNLDETVRTMIEGESGLLRCSAPWSPATVVKGVVTWPNGAIATPFTPEVPAGPRGPEHDLVWLSELASFPASTRDEFFSNMRLGLRLGLGRMIYDTTPKRRNPLVRYLIERAERDPARHIIVRGSTRDNRDNLTADFVTELEGELGDTNRAKEELLGVFLDDSDGSLWKQEWIDRARRDMPSVLKRRVISVDPAVSSRRGSDRSGIVDLGLGIDDQAYVIEDLTDRYAPEVWGALVIDRYLRGSCDCVVVERNRGGDLVASLLRASAAARGLRVEVVDKDAPTRHTPSTIVVKELTSRQGKETRAEPIATAYQQGKVSHVRGANLTELEETMCTWVPEARGDSPDSMDALVHGISELLALSRASKADGPAAVRGAAAMQASLSAQPQAQRANIAAMLGGARGGDRI